MGVPLLLLLTYRVGYTPPFGSRSFHTTLTLQSLSEADTVAMASRILGTEHFPAAQGGAAGEGRRGAAVCGGGGQDPPGCWRAAAGQRWLRVVQGLAARVPDTVQDIIMARLDRLGEEGKRTVQLASVIGRQFLVRLLERIADLTGPLEGCSRSCRHLRSSTGRGYCLRTRLCVQARPDPRRGLQQSPAAATQGVAPAVGVAIEDLYPSAWQSIMRSWPITLPRGKSGQRPWPQHPGWGSGRRCFCQC